MFGLDSVYCVEDKSSEKCFYDALVESYYEVNADYGKVIEDEEVRYKISKIELTGIGTCLDSCSVDSLDAAIDSFIKATNKDYIKSRFCCLNEENVIKAAEIGFESIITICEKNF